MPLKISLDETIAASPNKVWAALVHLPTWPLWVPNLMRLEVENDAPLAVGSQWCEVRGTAARDATEHYQVTALEPERLLALHVDGRKGATGRGDYHFRYRLDPVPIGTRMNLEADILEMGWLFRRVFGRLFHRGIRATLAADLTAFKRHVESLSPH